MTAKLVIRALGTPAPKGSLTAIVRAGRALMIEDNKATKPWRKQLDAACVNAMRAHGSWLPSNDAVEVSILFLFDRPASVRRLLPFVRPDVDKLARCVLDQLTASGVVVDDARVTDLHAAKRYCEPGQAAGARIVVRAMSDQLAVL